MHPNLYYSHCIYERKREETLEELKVKVREINEAIECVEKCVHCSKAKKLAIDALQEEKKALKELMHKQVDKL